MGHDALNDAAEESNAKGSPTEASIAKESQAEAGDAEGSDPLHRAPEASFAERRDPTHVGRAVGRDLRVMETDPPKTETLPTPVRIPPCRVSPSPRFCDASHCARPQKRPH